MSKSINILSREEFELLSLADKVNYREHILTINPKEVESLPLEEKKRYYEEYRKFVLERKYTNLTPGATVIGPILKGVTGKICYFVSKAFTCPELKVVTEGLENIPEGPVIFAHTHQDILDNFIWNYDLKRHGLILHNREVNKLLILFQINTGLILVNRNNKEDRKNSKLDMVKLLLKGHSVHYFPEGTWNLSPNKLHLPMSFGVIDIAKKVGVPIIPVVQEHVYNKLNGKTVVTEAYIFYGKPIYVSLEDSVYEKLEKLSEIFATTKYLFIEKKGKFKRENISNDEYVDFLRVNSAGMELGQVQEEKESSNVYGADSFFRKMCPINEVPCVQNENGEWILSVTEERKKMEYDFRMYGSNVKSIRRVLEKK